MTPLRDRVEAGARLADALRPLQPEQPVVLGLPRGGVPVAAVVADQLGAPLDVVVARKLGAPGQAELAMGAVSEGGVLVVYEEVQRAARVTNAQLAVVATRAHAAVERQVARYRLVRPPLEVRGRTAVVVDDGMATGSTARAACQVVRGRGARRVVLAVPVAARSSLAETTGDADTVICLETPEPFVAIGRWYQNFSPVHEHEVLSLLRRAAGMPPLRGSGVPGRRGGGLPTGTPPTGTGGRGYRLRRSQDRRSTTGGGDP